VFFFAALPIGEDDRGGLLRRAPTTRLRRSAHTAPDVTAGVFGPAMVTAAEIDSLPYAPILGRMLDPWFPTTKLLLLYSVYPNA